MLLDMNANRIGFNALDKAVSSSIRAQMAKVQVTQKQLAEELQMFPNRFARKYRGETAFTTGELIQVSRILNIPLITFITEAEAALAATTKEGGDQ